MGNSKNDILDYYNDPRLINALANWDVLTFLSDHDVDYQMEGKNIGINFVGISPCPECGDSRYHFGVHKGKKFGSCFICKNYMGPLKLVSYYGHMSIDNAFRYLINEDGAEKDVETRVREIIYPDLVKTIPSYKNIKDILPASRTITIADLRKNSNLKNFFIEKNLNMIHVKRYGLRIGTEEKLKNYIIWPVWYKNKLVSFQRRNFKYKRYHNPTNLHNYIYGYDWIIPNKPLLLVEGFLDYTRVDTYLRCNNINEISLTTGMLKSISNEQINRIIEAKPSSIIVMFDNDSWFDYWRIRNSFPFNVFYTILPKDHDPNMLSWTQLTNLFEKEILNVI